MNINKHIKPNLIDTKITNKISRTLNHPQKDYWKPTKNFLQKIYADWIEPNFYFFFFLFVIIILLLCRYRMIQNQRIELMMSDPIYNENKINQNQDLSQNFVQNTALNNNKSSDASPANILLNIYDKSKDLALEPKINTSKRLERVEWADPNSAETYEKMHGINLVPKNNEMKKKKNSDKFDDFAYGSSLAYPMYPYVKGGTFK